MRDSISGLWLMSIVIVFMMVLIAFISISINYSTAYRVKTTMVTRIEQYDGFNNTTISELNGIMSGYGYTAKGYCISDDGNIYYGVTGTQATKNPISKQNYCVYRETASGDDDEGVETKYYYRVTVFFGFSLPVLGNIYTFRVSGETREIYYPSSSDLFGSVSSSYVAETTTTTTGGYNISITVENGTADVYSFKNGIKPTITANEGYKLANAEVSCGNDVTGKISSTSGKLTLSNVKSDTSCSIKLKLKTDISATLLIYKGKGGYDEQNNPVVTYDENNASSRLTTYDGSPGTTVQSKTTYEIPTGYKVASGSPTCGSYSNKTFSITLGADDQTCKLYLEPKLHTISVTTVQGTSTLNIYFNETKTITFDNINLDGYNITCNEKKVALTKSESTDSSTGYEYSFKYKLTKDEDVTCTISQ